MKITETKGAMRGRSMWTTKTIRKLRKLKRINTIKQILGTLEYHEHSGKICKLRKLRKPLQLWRLGHFGTNKKQRRFGQHTNYEHPRKMQIRKSGSLGQ